MCSRYELQRTDDGSIRGTVKMIESLKIKDMEKEQQKLRRRGDGSASFITNYRCVVYIANTNKSIEKIYHNKIWLMVLKVFIIVL